MAWNESDQEFLDEIVGMNFIHFSEEMKQFGSWEAFAVHFFETCELGASASPPDDEREARERAVLLRPDREAMIARFLESVANYQAALNAHYKIN